jgi:hypothetical protein
VTSAAANKLARLNHGSALSNCFHLAHKPCLHQSTENLRRPSCQHCAPGPLQLHGNPHGSSMPRVRSTHICNALPQLAAGFVPDCTLLTAVATHTAPHQHVPDEAHTYRLPLSLAFACMHSEHLSLQHCQQTSPLAMHYIMPLVSGGIHAANQNRLDQPPADQVMASCCAAAWDQFSAQSFSG